jgi:SAM-dependent methyltransferase
MNLGEFRSLLSPAGQEALRAAVALTPREEDYLRYFQELSRRFAPDLARSSLEIAIQRRAAATKFPFADQLFFSREALEQASSWEVAVYRSGRLRGFNRILDLGCSAGGDTLALAGAAPVVGVDIDPLRLAMAEANLRALEREERSRLIRADLRQPLPLRCLDHTAIFFDPARRAAGRRLRSVESYQPPLQIVRMWLEDYPAIAVKVSPGVELAQLEGYDAEVEFISLNGELKEAALWFGPLKSAHRRATLLPAGHTLTEAAAALPIRQPGAYIYEPDPAVLRAGLVAVLGEQIGAAQLDPDIAYLTADHRVSTPFARVWTVEGWMPFSVKRLRSYLRERNVGRVTVKKRGSPLQPEALIHDLRLQGDEERLVFLTHLSGRPISLIARSP